MINMFFGNIFSLLTTILVLGLLAFIALSLVRRNEIKKWGRLILILILAGTAVSALSATRDAFMTANALFSLNSLQSMACSIAGAIIFLTGIIAVFVKNQKFRKTSFSIISVLFIVQVLTIEISRIAFSIAGAM
ncbi:MAG: hypothetical protein GYA50_07785 [Eubacteriaceae bacterium]|nr:hypothetical protein [Eubacteriaceae bacterium]